jgi:hypothetical protein
MTDKIVISQNPVEGSICETCCSLVRRIIIPFEEEEFGIDRAELDIPDEEEIYCEHFFCKEMLMDLDHLVITCNKYKKECRESIIRNNSLLLS